MSRLAELPVVGLALVPFVLAACDDASPEDAGAGLDAAAAVDAGGTDAGTATDGAATDAALTPTGEACVVSSVPMGGFDTREIYLEVSPSCGGTCMVYQLDGDPSPGCAGADCADPMEIADRVFCTCRCGGPDPSLDYCACPSTMTCVPDVVTTGGAGIVGDYCVRAGL